MSTREAIAFLVGSESRLELLRTLRDRPSRPSELADECSCARETAQRTVGAFVDRGWARKENGRGRYALTASGVLVAEGYEAFEARVSVADRFSVLLENLGGVVSDLDPVVFDRLRGTTATPDDPHAPIDRFLAVVGTETVSEFRGVTPIVSRVFNEAARRIIGQQSNVELVIDERVFETSASEYPDDLTRAYELDQFDLFVCPERLTFGLMLVDGHAYLAAYDDHGNLLASVDGTDREFVEWAERTYRAYRTRSYEPTSDETEAEPDDDRSGDDTDSEADDDRAVQNGE
ncbi:helix-turn-helix transcriptional regulator [Halogeometricum limi]|uniref:Predicted transcriptional regulator, contains HTH domain n=1 Tax=Halogeometricum limi TaxID=555875 RepID=A0A1I6IS20_9EURY|nr:hypothetical protein [Halogeometricum limi]SFR69522.1 Predicted transcriptional regulator, contains HTH domain [Halogeometricum limi]